MGRRGIGPGMPLANAILAQNQSFRAIGLFPCAKQGIEPRYRSGLFFFFFLQLKYHLSGVQCSLLYILKKCMLIRSMSN